LTAFTAAAERIFPLHYGKEGTSDQSYAGRQALLARRHTTDTPGVPQELINQPSHYNY